MTASKRELRERGKMTDRMIGFMPDDCPICHERLRPFLYGQVTRFGALELRGIFTELWRGVRGVPLPTCTLICWECKQVVGWRAEGVAGYDVLVELSEEAAWRMMADAY